MHDDVRSVIERTQQDGSGYRVVHNQWNAVLVCGIRQRFDVTNVPCWIPYAFTEERSGVVIHELLEGIGPIVFRKPNSNSEFREDVSEKGVGSTVELRNGDDVPADLS